MEDNIEKEEAGSTPEIQQAVLKYCPAQAAIKNFAADLILLGVHQLPGALSVRLRQILHTVSIAQKEIELLHPISPHTKIAIQLHFHALVGQRMGESRVRQSVLLLFGHLKTWNAEILRGPSQQLAELLHERRISMFSFKERRSHGRRGRWLPLAERRGLLGTSSVPNEEGKHRDKFQGETYKDDERQVNEVFFEESNDSPILTPDKADSSGEEDRDVGIPSSPVVSESEDVSDSETSTEIDSENTANSNTSTLLGDDLNTTKPSDLESDSTTSATPLTSEGQKISDVAETYDSKEAVIQDYEFALSNQRTDHDDTIEDLKEDHDNETSDLRSDLAKQIQKIRDESEAELQEVLKDGSRRNRKSRERFLQKIGEAKSFKKR